MTSGKYGALFLAYYSEAEFAQRIFPQVSSRETGFPEKLQSEISRQDRQVEAQQDNL